jgi:crotonobetainyl-CoA:carnitine CoA-transferase CaiB-like acyl-CoA transferase
MVAIVPRLLAWADVVHHNMRPGAAERLGIGYEQARAANPDVVYAHAPGWGTSGPDMGRQSFAPLVSGYVGASYEVAGQFNPPTYPVGNEDPGAGMAGAIGILMALLRGGGAYIECPQVNAAMNQVSHIVRGADGEPLNVSTLDPLQRRTGPTDGLYETADGWICIVAATPAQRTALGAASGVEIADNPADEATTADRLEKVFAGATTAEWLERLQRAGVPALRPISANNNRAFVFDPENRRTRRVSEAVSATFGPLRQIDSLIRATDSAIPPYRPAPELGEHTAELLTELGCTPADIASLAHAGAIRLGDADALPSTAATQA